MRQGWLGGQCSALVRQALVYSYNAMYKLLKADKHKGYRHLTVARQGRKTGNRQIFWNIEQLDEAITHKKKATLDYLHYGYDKRQHPIFRWL